ncbi:serine hydrolase-like protein 2 [Bubalus kerabau]|uniref:serine hydrolase-like protein 2 n=1 Tax=Bubalus carabanensis TaxID=3119969 RepID=UPI00244EF897|nr:serine hydrolase-like protein 2 [Bubalus carabanensis]XP_055422096.1 serine hydrolase-like protein 2 [Bubalus carabanensis]
MDFGGHGLSSHYSPGFPYHYQNFVSEVWRVAAALKWNRFSLLGHSFGGAVGGMFSCIFPEMVDKLILLESLPFFLDTNEMDNLLTYTRRATEHVLQVEASRKPAHVVSPEEMLQRLLKKNSHAGEECGKHLLQRGTTQVATASSFRIWNSSTRILSLLGASVRHSARGKGHEEGGSAYAKAGSSLRSTPGNSRASTPKPESAYFRLCALTYTSDFMGAVPHHPLKKRVSLQLQLIIPGCDSV